MSIQIHTGVNHAESGLTYSCLLYTSTVLDGLRPTYRNAYGEDIEQASYDLALNIYKEMSMIPQRQTFKDKADAAVEREWKEANRVYLTMLQDYRKECEKQFLEGLKAVSYTHLVRRIWKLLCGYGRQPCVSGKHVSLE